MNNYQEDIFQITESLRPTLKERTNLIADELLMSAKWERPCILFAVYRSEYVKEKIIADLKDVGGLCKKELVSIKVNKRNYDIPLLLKNYPKKTNRIFLISGLRWGGGKGYSNAYRALNMHREYLVEGKTLCMFWLTLLESKQITRYAPDFWAFRHAVVEFLDFPSNSDLKDSLKTSDVTNISTDSLMALLKKDPKDFNTLKEIACNYYAMKCYDEAIIYFRRALRMNSGDKELLIMLPEAYRARKRPFMEPGCRELN